MLSIKNTFGGLLLAGTSAPPVVTLCVARLETNLGQFVG